jgi:hypothetical protein
MATQHRNSRTLKLALAAALLGLALLILMGSVDISVVQAGCPVGALLGAAFQAIPSILIQEGLRAIQTCLFDRQAFLPDCMRMLLSFWLLLLLILGTALLRSRSTATSEGSSTPSK